MDDLTAELAEHLGTSERQLAVFDDCAAVVAQRRRSLAQAVHGFADSGGSTGVHDESAGQERDAS